MSEAKQAALRARAAQPALVVASTELKNKALFAMASALRQHVEEILKANAQDCDKAKQQGMNPSMLDRLMLDDKRIEAMAAALESLASLDDPVGRVIEQRELYNGLSLRKVSVPLGVVAMVYEARPNVTVDAAGICLKSGNAAVLRGGSSAVHSNMALAHVLRDALVQVGLPADVVMAIESTDRAETDTLLSLHGIVDVLIPRGGAGLIQHCVKHAQVPVIETGTGNCHVYVHETADVDMARAIVMNAKTQRPGVCNAEESLLVDKALAREFLPRMMRELVDAGVMIHGDKTVCTIAAECDAARPCNAINDLTDGSEKDGTGVAADGVHPSAESLSAHVFPALEDDWGREYLDLEISIKVIEDGVDEAIAHINTYGTGHSEAIITRDKAVASRFEKMVDAAAVYVNASTRFTDGGEFGLGAEIGISTQKLHVRGPFALEALTSSKYLIEGEGQVRA